MLGFGEARRCQGHTDAGKSLLFLREVYREGWWDKWAQALWWFTKGTLLSISVPVLPGNCGSGGRIVIEGKTVMCSKAAWSSGACGKGSDGRIISRGVLGGEELQLM